MYLQKEGPNSEFDTSRLQTISFSKELTDNY